MGKTPYSATLARMPHHTLPSSERDSRNEVRREFKRHLNSHHEAFLTLSARDLGEIFKIIGAAGLYDDKPRDSAMW